MNELPVSISFTVFSVGFPLSKLNMVCMQIDNKKDGGAGVIVFITLFIHGHTHSQTHAHKNKFDLLLMEIDDHFRYLTSGNR